MKSSRITAAALVVSLAIPSFAGIGSKEAAYRGGTVSTIKEGMETAFTLGETDVLFHTLKIPYKQITEIEYGQKAGRRVGAAIGMTVLAGPVGLAMLASKKRKHFVTLTWNDGTANQAAVFELGKDAVRVTLTTLEVRTGKKIEYQDDEARKHAAN